MYDIVNKINAPEDVKKLDMKELEALGYIKVIKQSLFRTAIQLIHV